MWEVGSILSPSTVGIPRCMVLVLLLPWLPLLNPPISINRWLVDMLVTVPSLPWMLLLVPEPTRAQLTIVRIVEVPRSRLCTTILTRGRLVLPGLGALSSASAFRYVLTFIRRSNLMLTIGSPRILVHLLKGNLAFTVVVR